MRVAALSRSSSSYFDGLTSTLSYDAALRLASQTDPNDTDANGNPRTIRFGYDTRSRRTSITYPSGVSELMTYDKGGRVSTITLQKGNGTKVQSFSYAYGFDANGVRTADYYKGFLRSVTELDGSVTSYSYDDLDRLISATRTGTHTYNESYTYDANDNRTGVTSGGVTTTATYDAANQMTSLGGVSYSYDRNGNLVAYGGNTLTYDASNTWTDGTVNGSSLAFSYDGLGRRTSYEADGAYSDYWYDRTGLTDVSGSKASTYLRDPDGLLLSRYSGGALGNYGRDSLGSATMLTGSATGGVGATFRYDAWGQVIYEDGGGYSLFRYAGAPLDPASGLSMMGQRYYQPASGRFTQQDPLPLYPGYASWEEGRSGTKGARSHECGKETLLPVLHPYHRRV